MAKKTAVVEDDDELEELAEDEAEETPAKGSSKQEVEFGVADLAKYLTKKGDKEIKPKDLRTLIRKMAREDKPRVSREVVPGNKSRYDWPGGLENPEVKKIIKAVLGGELEQGKREALAKLKEQKAAKAAAAGDGGGKKSKKSGKKSAPVAEPDDDDIEDFEDD